MFFGTYFHTIVCPKLLFVFQVTNQQKRECGFEENRGKI